MLKQSHLIIFLPVSFFAIHNLVFLSTFEINFPYSVDFSDQFNDIFYSITEGKDRFFATKGFHIILFPKLISYPFLYFSNFDVTHLYYFQWIINSASLYICFLIIKQTDKKLFWTLIPISSFLYSPLTSSGYWAMSLLPWLFAMFGILLTIYLFNRKKIHLVFFNIGILAAIFSTFSIVMGVISWLSGSIMLLKNYSASSTKNKKFIILWACSIIVVGIFYFSLVSDSSESFHYELLFTPSGFSFITHYIASSFRLKFEFFMIIVGSISLIISFFLTYFFIRKGNLKNYLPWFIFLLIGASAAIITALGRVQFLDSHLGNEPYYTPISQLFQIGIIVLSAKIISDYKKISKKNILVLIFTSIIILQMILLIPSYYAGWQRGEYYFEEKTRFISCFSLKPDQSCKNIMTTLEPDFLQMINHLIKNHYSIFDDTKFIEKNELIVNNFSEYVKSNTKFSENIKIDSINNISIQDQKSFRITESVISLSGSIISTTNLLPDELYIFVDGDPFLKINDNDIQISQNNDMFNISWSSNFMSGYIESGCHSINIVNINDLAQISDNNKISICV